ncbi:hypothetical protein NVP2275O_379 [Vibrio phage 2.275.O._10N.286.54.E11]|nr:hypothetical protein NVP2275O_379 [Vibrio phage 2.275.O._10N.286.54.E11]
MSNTLDKFGVPLPSGRQAMKQPKPKFRFRVMLFGFGATGDGDQVSYETNSVDIPSIDYESMTVDAYNSKMNYKGKYTIGTFSLAVRDTVGNAPMRAVMNQMRKEFDHFSQESRTAAAQYKFEVWIQSLDGSDATERAGGDLFTGTLSTHVCQGCMVTSFSEDNFDYASSDAHLLTLTIQPDNMVVLDENGEAMGAKVEELTSGTGLSAPASNHVISSDPFDDNFTYAPDLQ